MDYELLSGLFEFVDNPSDSISMNISTAFTDADWGINWNNSTNSLSALEKELDIFSEVYKRITHSS